MWPVQEARACWRVFWSLHSRLEKLRESMQDVGAVNWIPYIGEDRAGSIRGGLRNNAARAFGLCQLLTCRVLSSWSCSGRLYRTNLGCDGGEGVIVQVKLGKWQHHLCISRFCGYSLQYQYLKWGGCCGFKWQGVPWSGQILWVRGGILVGFHC